MKQISKEDREFLQRVLAKTTYLEYLKHEDEIVRENCRKIRKKRMIVFIASILIATLFVVIVKFAKFNFGIVCFLSVIMLTLACLYEYREEKVAL
ncbi:hypothetical protein [Clostridium brassicae]|uniref:DUF3040 domain-containing protein n=1 Tax=Clostridium brassicae TaxID=2999072 RepID=A0ABT4D4H0_9CLOT|nr:hypothetical protein [Clostridium brassicae]MCY6957180.1 hypothetical protein [Clostridium brassicae]